MINSDPKNPIIEVAKEFVELMHEMQTTMDDVNGEFEFLRDFFADYKTSYSLSLAYPEELWKVTADNLNIKTEGKSRLQLSKEVFTHASPLSKEITDNASNIENIDKQT